MKPKSIKYQVAENLLITATSWERIFFNFVIKADVDEARSFSLAKIHFLRREIKFDETYSGNTNQIPAELLREIPLIPYETSDGEYKFRINMSIIDGNSFLENGQWYFVARTDDDAAYRVIPISIELAYDIDRLGKTFMYGKSKHAYVVSFAAYSMDTEHVIPVLVSKFMIENTHWKESYVISQRKTIRGKISCIMKMLKISILQFLYNLVGKFRKNKGKNILLMSETKPFLWGNLKYLDDRIKARGIDKDYNVSYSFRIAVGKNNSALNWFKTISLLAKQDIIFVDDYAPVFSFIELRPDTKLVQVWHAGEGFKSVGYGRFGGRHSPYPEGSCHRKYDYVVTGSKRLAEIYSEVFGQPMEHMLPLGMARLDGFLDENVIAEKTARFYSEHPEAAGKKLILFCPTFRGPNQKQAYYNYDMLDVKQIYDFCGDEYIWAFKMHPFVHKKPPIPAEYSDRIIDLTANENINDLYYVTDIMITDYSSAYFEYALLKKPVLFYTYDREVYEITRGVHKSILETAPGKVCDTFDDLMGALKSGDYEIEKTIRFNEENFGEYDGHAADRIIDTLILGK